MKKNNKGFIVSQLAITIVTLMAMIMASPLINAEQKQIIKERLTIMLNQEISKSNVPSVSVTEETIAPESMSVPAIEPIKLNPPIVYLFNLTEKQDRILWKNGNSYGNIYSGLWNGAYIETDVPTTVTLEYSLDNGATESVTADMALGHIFVFKDMSDLDNEINPDNTKSVSLVNMGLKYNSIAIKGYKLVDANGNEYIFEK